MKINPGEGIDSLLFGMKANDVKAVYGLPDKTYKDEDENLIVTYNAKKLRLTFYAEEDFRLGYIVASDKDLDYNGIRFIGKQPEESLAELNLKGLVKWTQESFDTYDNWLNEDNWFTLQSEFGEIVKVELGALINAKDEFTWKFHSK